MIRTKPACSAKPKSETSDGPAVRTSRFTTGQGVEEVHLCVTPGGPGDFATQLVELEQAHDNALLELGLPKSSTVLRRFFLSDAANQESRLLACPLAHSPPDDPIAVSIVEQPPLPEGRVALWSYLLHHPERGVVKRARDGGVLVETQGASQLFLSDSRRLVAGSTPTDQTRAAFRAISRELGKLGGNLRDHLVRTWIFVHDIDLHYGDMVEARRELMLQQGLCPATHYVASTGIAGRRADPRHLVQLEVYAIPSVRPGQIRYLQAPGQLGPTSAYGVTFERGVCIDHGDRRHLIISGTASIDSRGNTLHENAIAAQTERTFQNVRGLLRDGEADLNDIVQMIVYLRDPADHHVVAPFLQEHFPHLPYLLVRAPVCRPGWLIEVECWAVIGGGNPEWGRL